MKRVDAIEKQTVGDELWQKLANTPEIPLMAICTSIEEGGRQRNYHRGQMSWIWFVDQSRKEEAETNNERWNEITHEAMSQLSPRKTNKNKNKKEALPFRKRRQTKKC